MNDNARIAIFSGAAIAALFYVASDSSGKASTVIATPGVALTPREFVRAYYGAAKSSEVATGVPALVTLAQGALESGWGKHAPGYNFFGIKPGKSWKGAIQYLKTWECGKTGNATTDNIKDQVLAVYAPGDTKGLQACKNGNMYSYRTMSPFRAYPNAAQSFYDHGQFLRNNSRYSAAFATKTPEAFIRVVATAGYATSTPGYADLVIQIMNGIRTRIKELGLGYAIHSFGEFDAGEPTKSMFPVDRS